MSVIIGMGILSGCVLDSPIQYGESCPGVSYIKTGNDQCMLDSCSWGDIYFKVEMCPETQPFCIEIPDEEIYCASECPKGTHSFEDAQKNEDGEQSHDCEADTIEHCGPRRVNCAESSGWMRGSCKNQQCIAEKCTESYRLDENTCKPYGLCCGRYCAHCTEVKDKETGKSWVCSGVDKAADCIKSCPEGQTNRDGLCIDPHNG